MKAWLQELLFDWVFVLLYRMLQGLLNLVEFIESFFDVFAGTAKIYYKGDADFLLNVFFGHDSVTNAFWAMALIAMVLSFAFCIVQLARKVTDISGSVRQTVGQIMSNFFRCLLIIVLINACTVAAINITNVLLDRINYALENAAVLDQSEQDKSFTDQEYATMTKILATVANYSVNPSATSRYNVNSCFNAIRPDLLSLHVNGFFNYDYPLDENGHYSWQGAIALLAASADLTQDLNLDTYYADVVTAFTTVSDEISTYSDFYPTESAHFSIPGTLDTDDLIFLIVGMEAAQNPMFNNGDFYDSLRKGYISGEKSYDDLTQVRKDFDIWDMDYLVGYVSCITFIVIMAICIFTFIVRIFNILLLYISAPLFASSMPLDDGSKWTNWIQAFVIQLFSGFGLVVAMRLYLIIIPIVVGSDLVFFAGEGVGVAILNHMAQLLMVLGGAWAVLQSGGVITGILAGNPGMAAIHQEGQIGNMVSGWATRAPRAALRGAGKILGGVGKAAKYVGGTGERSRHKADQKASLAARRAQQRQNKADAQYAAAQKKKLAGDRPSSVNRAMKRAASSQEAADKAIQKAEELNRAAGGTGVDIRSSYSPRFSSSGSTRENNPFLSNDYIKSYIDASKPSGDDGGGSSVNIPTPPQRNPYMSYGSSSTSSSYSAPITRARDTNDIVSGGYTGVKTYSRDTLDISSKSAGSAANIPAGQRADYWRNSSGGSVPPRGSRK